MVTLGSPLEALAFNYLAYGFLTAVTNIWEWWATVITASVSFWRIRSAPSLPELSSAEEQLDTVASSESVRVLEREGSTKMKFCLYYEEEKCSRDDDGGGEGKDDGGEAAAVSEKWWCDDWEKAMAMRMGDMGWYKWQDMTALDGCVVRLWEGRRQREAAALVGGNLYLILSS